MNCTQLEQAWQQLAETLDRGSPITLAIEDYGRRFVRASSGRGDSSENCMVPIGEHRSLAQAMAEAVYGLHQRRVSG